MVASVSVPVTEYLPDRRIIMDWCFNTQFNFPSKLSSFYSVPIWPVKKTKRQVNSLFNDTEIQTQHQKYTSSLRANKHPRDFTAGELYQNIEDFLSRYLLLT